MSSKPASTWLKSSRFKIFIVGLLSLFVVVSAVPRYLSAWPWSDPLKVPNQLVLQSIRDEGLSLPGWQENEQVKTRISNNTWSIQQLSPTDALSASDNEALANIDQPIFLLLRPQVWEADHPEVEWVDIKGSQRWQTDEQRRLSISLQDTTAGASEQNQSKTVRIYPDYFRARSQEQTFAVLQWYAWPKGGSASVINWFWGDQKTQWIHRQRLPWVAVQVWFPIEPFGDIDAYENRAIAVSEQVQLSLASDVFADSPSDS